MPSTTPTRLALLAAFALSALALAACGGGDSTTTDTTQGTPLTHDDFIAQADAICQSGSDELASLQTSLGNNPTPDQLNKVVEDDVVPNLQDQLNQIEALGAPDGETAQVDEITSGLSDAIDTLQSDPSAITDPNLFADVNGLAGSYGLKVCGAA